MTVRRELLLIVVIGLSILSSPSSNTAAFSNTGSTQLGPATSIPSLRARIEAILARNRVAGASITLANRDGIIWADGIGTLSTETGEPATVDTIFRLGSVTKNVVALALMQQVEQGRLSLDAQLRDIAPEVPYENAWEDSHPVTVATLLEHTAGFEFNRFNEDFEVRPQPLLDALLLNPRARVSRWPPGTRMSYSNEGYVVAGYLLEKITHRPLDDVVREGVFIPLGMNTAALRLTPATAGQVAIGYDELHDRAVPYLEDRQRPAANLLASAADMSRYLLFWVRGGDLNGTRLLSPAGIERMQERRTLPYGAPDNQYGLGTETALYYGFVAHGHAGFIDGFVSSFRYFPREGVGWALTLNQNIADPRGEIEDQLVGFLLHGVAPSNPPAYPESIDRMAQLTGFYRDATPLEVIKAPLTVLFSGTQVELRGDTLWERTSSATGLRSLISLGTWQQLVPTGPGAFRHPGEPISTMFFTREESGGDVLIRQDGYSPRDSLSLTFVKRGLFLAAITLMLTGLVVVPIRGLLTLTPLGAELGPPLAWLPLFLASLPPFAAWLVLSRSPELLGHLNATTVSVFGLSIAFALLSALSLAGTLWTMRTDAVVLAKAYMLLVSVAGMGLTAFAWRAHWIGLRTWLW